MEEEEIYTEASPLLQAENKSSLNHDSVFVSSSNRNSAVFMRNVTISPDLGEQVLYYKQFSQSF